MPGSGGNSENRHRDVVGTTEVQRHLYQLEAHLRGRKGLSDAGQFPFAHHSPEAVGAKHECVVRFQGKGTIGKVRCDALTRTEGSGEDVALRMGLGVLRADDTALDRKSTRLNSSHLVISYAVFCLK